MQILKWRIFLDYDKERVAFLNRFLQDPECLILVAERYVNTHNINRLRFQLR